MRRHGLRRLVWICIVAWSFAGSAGAQAPSAYDDYWGEAEAPAAPQQRERPGWLERERAGPPYEAQGRWYVPTVEPGYEQTGTASWYGAGSQGQLTASGEAFDQRALTGAHPTLPIPSLVQVTNLENGREVIVRINDRGPFTGSRLIDVSRAAAEALGFVRTGEARVHLRYLGPAPRPVGGGLAGGAGDESWTDDSYLEGAPAGRGDRHTCCRGGYAVQVGAFAYRDNAQRAIDIARAAGPVSVDIIRTAAHGRLFRVRVGPWATHAQAEAARCRLVPLGFADAMVVRTNRR